MIKRLRSISAELAGALLGRCGCRRRGGVGAKAAPVCHGWVPLWEGCPAVDGLYGCCRCARARVRRRAMPRAPACDKLRCERHFGVGLCRPNWKPDGSESSFEVAGAEDSSGRPVCSGLESCLPLQRRRRLSRYALLAIVGTPQHVNNLYDERAKRSDCLDRALTSASHTSALVATAINRAKPSRNNAISASEHSQ